MHRKFWMVVPLMLLLVGCATFGNRTVNISEAELQKRLNERLALPISLLKIFDVSLSNSLVQFDAKTGRMTTTMDANVSSMLTQQPVAGKLGISGHLRFDPTDNSVKLDSPKIERLDLNGLGAKYGDFFNVLAQQLGTEMLDGMTLYTIKPEDLNYRGKQYTAKNLQVTNRGLEMTFAPAP